MMKPVTNQIDSSFFVDFSTLSVSYQKYFSFLFNSEAPGNPLLVQWLISGPPSAGVPNSVAFSAVMSLSVERKQSIRTIENISIEYNYSLDHFPENAFCFFVPGEIQTPRFKCSHVRLEEKVEFFSLILQVGFLISLASQQAFFFSGP